MNKILLFAITLLLPIGLNAQTNYLQDKVAEYYTGSIEQKIKMDSDRKSTRLNSSHQ